MRWMECHYRGDHGESLTEMPRGMPQDDGVSAASSAGRARLGRTLDGVAGEGSEAMSGVL